MEGRTYFCEILLGGTIGMFIGMGNFDDNDRWNAEIYSASIYHIAALDICLLVRHRLIPSFWAEPPKDCHADPPEGSGKESPAGNITARFQLKAVSPNFPNQKTLKSQSEEQLPTSGPSSASQKCLCHPGTAW
ncbi:hypothetical protein CBS147346_4738 [Aspergillus niger]|nr:hypothetical protein CBS147346_4738 [Aspergillus niger]